VNKFKPGSLVKFTNEFLAKYSFMNIHGNGMIVKFQEETHTKFSKSMFYYHILFSDGSILFFGEIHLEKLKHV
jgi:hypothetical protein